MILNGLQRLKRLSLPELTTEWRQAGRLFGLLAAALCLLHLLVIWSMIKVWWGTTTYNHGFFVAPVAAWLIWRRREAFLAMVPKGSPLALIPMSGAIILTLAGRLGGINIAQHVGFVGALMCLFPLVLGWRITRAFWFPIFFLLFMVPVGEFLTPYLQEMTADASVWMLRQSGIPVFREGIMIELPRGLFEVAEACAGLRFLIANIVVATVFAYFSYSKAWKWVAFMTLALVVPILSNFVRAYGIMMIAHLTNNKLAVGVDHLVYGWVFFTAVMLLLIWLGGLFADRNMQDPATPEPNEAVQAHLLRRRFAVLAIGILALPLIVDHATRPSAGAQPRFAQVDAPGWQSVTASEDWVPVFDTADVRKRLRFEKEGEAVDVYIAWYTHQRGEREAVYFANRFDDDEEWVRSKLSSTSLGTALPPARLDVLTRGRIEMNDDGRASGSANFQSREVISWVWVNGRLVSGGKSAKLQEIAGRLSAGRPEAAVFALSKEYRGKGGREEARTVMARFLNDLGDPAALLASIAK